MSSVVGNSRRHVFSCRGSNCNTLFQAQPTTFNRGLLVNIGATFAMNSETAYNCLVIHDVDLLPMIDSNIYTCGSNPRHMSSANSKFGYR